MVETKTCYSCVAQQNLPCFMAVAPLGLKCCATAVVVKAVPLSKARQYSCSTTFETGLKDLQN